MLIFHQPENSIGNHSYNAYFYDEIDFGFHFHKNFEIIYVISGNAICSVNNQKKIIEQGEFVLCLPNEVHSIKSIDNAKVWVGVFSEDFIHEFAKHIKGKRGADFSFRCSESVMRYLAENFIKEELSDIFAIKSCLYALCGEYLRQIPLVENIEKQSSIMPCVIDYVENNYKKPISLATLAESLGYDYCYFSRIFNRFFSMSFSDYLNIYRFNEARNMLTETDISITAIAYESGFQSVRSFNNTFKKLSGISPSEWRNQTICAKQKR